MVRREGLSFVVRREGLSFMVRRERVKFCGEEQNNCHKKTSNIPQVIVNVHT